MVEVPTLLLAVVFIALVLAGWMPVAFTLRDVVLKWLIARLVHRYDIDSFTAGAIGAVTEDPAAVTNLACVLGEAGVPAAAVDDAVAAVQGWATDLLAAVNEAEKTRRAGRDQDNPFATPRT